MANTSQHLGRILITGATSGLGKSLCEYALDKNAFVIAHGRDPSKYAHIHGYPSKRLVPVIADLKIKEQWEIVENAIHDYSPNLLILNAGYNAVKKSASEWTGVEILEMYNVNLISNIFFLRAFLNSRACSDGRVVAIILSSACFSPRTEMSLYNSCKAGLMGYGRSLQQEAAMLNVRTILFYPGKINSAFRPDDHSEYMSCDSVANLVFTVLSLPSDILPREFRFTYPVDDRIEKS